MVGSVVSTRCSGSTTTHQPAPSRARRSAAETWWASTTPKRRRSTAQGEADQSMAPAATKHARDRGREVGRRSSAVGGSTRPGRWSGVDLRRPTGAAGRSPSGRRTGQLGEERPCAEGAGQGVHNTQRPARRQQPAQVECRAKRRGQPDAAESDQVAPEQRDSRPPRRAPAGVGTSRGTGSDPRTVHPRSRPVDDDVARPGEDRPRTRGVTESGAVEATYTPRSTRRTALRPCIRDSGCARCRPFGHGRRERQIERKQGVKRMQREGLVHPRRVIRTGGTVERQSTG